MSQSIESKRLLVQMEMLEAGIAPVCPKASRDVMFFPLSASAVSLFDNPVDEARKFLASLPADEQRKAKRKFRKLWRKSVDQSVKRMKGRTAPRAASDLRRRMSTMVTDSNGKRHPDNRAMHFRIHSVYGMFLENVLNPSE